MKDEELYFIIDALKQIVKNIIVWEKDYNYIPLQNEYNNIYFKDEHYIDTKKLFAF